MSIPWERANFLETREALATEIEGISVTMIDHGDHWTLAWSVNLNGEGTILPAVEEIAAHGARVLSEFFRESGHEHSPEDCDHS